MQVLKIHELVMRKSIHYFMQGLVMRVLIIHVLVM